MRHIQIQINAPAVTKGGSTERVAGFSDGWYQEEAGTNYALSEADRNLINARATLLPTTDTIVGAVVKYVDEWGRSNGRSRPTKLSILGGQTSLGDDPRMCLQYSCYGFNRSNELQLYIQHPPDARIVRGTYDPLQSWEDNIRAYLRYIQQGGYGFMGYDNTLPRRPIENITEGGLVTTSAGHGFNVGDYVRILDVKPELNYKYRTNPNGLYITAVPTTLTFQVQGWDWGATTGGTATKWAKVLCSPTISDDDIISPRVATRKVGKQFFGYRGRASSKS